MTILHNDDALPGCHGPCDQGRKLCPCPQACAVSQSEQAVRSMQHHAKARLYVGVLLVALVAVVAIFAPSV